MAMMDDYMSKNPYEVKRRGTFIVKVDDCSNETWHGNVVWADENRTRYFRSTLELIKLIDESLVEGDLSNNKESGSA